MPEDVTGVSTYHIVRQIRCETRETLRKTVITWLGRSDHPLPQRLSLQYQEDPALIRTFHYNLFKGPDLVRVRAIAKLFYDTGIAYNFDFDIMENNNLGADIGFLKETPSSKFTLGIGASANRKRANHRVFTVADTFSYLLTKVPEEYCNGYVVEANYIYPITGRIGADKVVHDFIELTLFGALRKEDHPDDPPTLTDTLTFTTAISASATPKIEFTPITEAFHLASASLTAVADRTDVHQVTIGLAIDAGSVKDVDPVRMGFFSSSRATLVAGRRVTGGGSRSEQLAVIAIDQVKSRELRLIPAQ
ncbi:MAG: hypothetical protein HY269_10395 [Deltaproteobacteria bacterium]|nr:hypothetical protein [Deltaproteobacteria bacterium]